MDNHNPHIQDDEYSFPLPTPFNYFKNEGALIGKLILAYGELELDIAGLCCRFSDEFNTEFRSLYKFKNHGQRLNAIKNRLQPIAQAAGFVVECRQTIAAFEACKNIRNHHAHSAFARSEDRLIVTNFNSMSRAESWDGRIPWKVVDMPLLIRQSEYFAYANRCLAGFEFLLMDEGIGGFPDKLEVPPNHRASNL